MVESDVEVVVLIDQWAFFHSGVTLPGNKTLFYYFDEIVDTTRACHHVRVRVSAVVATR